MIWDVDFARRLQHGDSRFELNVRFASDVSRLVLFGPSGVGKTQTLKVMAGIARPDRGHVRIAGLTLVDLPRSEACCGFGGTFAVKNADTSVAMGFDKVDDVLGSGAEVLTAGDTSCLMHIGGLLSRRRSPVRIMHLAEILATTEARA